MERKKDKIAKKNRNDRDGKIKEKNKLEQKQNAAKAAFSLLADEQRVDPTLSSLFAAKPTPPARVPKVLHSTYENASSGRKNDEENEDPEIDNDASSLSSIEGEDNADDSAEESVALDNLHQADHSVKRKRRRTKDEDEIEDVYMRRLAREEAKEAEIASADRIAKRRKTLEPSDEALVDAEDEEAEPYGASDDASDKYIDHEIEDDNTSPPPRHETEQAVDVELAKAKCTVFLGNVSTTAISSKAARKQLIDHLKSFFDSIPKPKDGEIKHKIESIRFRSAPYAPAIPRKASFARGEVVDATTKSTNAYAVYSTPTLAREATKRLNGTVILDRHLRVDSVAHPAAVDHKRCVFVGGLSFVDDESNIEAANEEAGRETRKRPKVPGDVEEGLWRTFGKCGTVESVRVIRDSTTRVGKGIAYVQFEDGIAVEAALLYDGCKFPPMLPRKLRVSRAKAVKRNKTPGGAKPTANGYQRKISGEEASRAGRVGKLFGRAAAAQQLRRPAGRVGGRGDFRGDRSANGVRRPESFVFEGHRASSKAGKSGLRKGKKKGGKPTTRSARRGSEFKAARKKHT